MALLEITNLHVALEGGPEIVKGVDLSVDLNQKHAIMGPNGSGKSTLAQVLAGRESYEVTDGSATFQGHDLLDMEIVLKFPQERYDVHMPAWAAAPAPAQPPAPLTATSHFAA